MRPKNPFAVACFTCLAFAAFAVPSLAQGTPIFTEDQKILASDGEAGDWFGFIGPSGLHDDLLIVGATDVDGSGGTDSGAAYIFRFNGSDWVEEAKIYPSDGTTDGYFGWNVAIYDNVAVVSATEDADPDNSHSAVYVYRFDGQDWIYEAKFIGDEDGSGTFGKSLAAQEDLIFIGDTGDYSYIPHSGSVSVYRYTDGEWVFEQKVYGSINQSYVSSKAWSIGADGERLIIGMNMFTLTPDIYAWVSINKYNGTEWVLEADLRGPEYSQIMGFGRAVDIESNVAVVGCPDDGSERYRGSVYIYRSSGAPDNEWVEEVVLAPADLQNNDFFGDQVVLADENTIIVQAGGHELAGYGRSTLYVYRYIDEEWVETGRLTTSSQGDFFGIVGGVSLAAEGTHVVVGSPREDNQNGVDAGSAFYYDLSCIGDFDNDRDVDQSDLGILLASYGVDDGGDVDGDGDTDQADLGLLLANYEEVCP